jgi:hypothetical protein
MQGEAHGATVRIEQVRHRVPATESLATEGITIDLSSKTSMPSLSSPLLPRHLRVVLSLT